MGGVIALGPCSKLAGLRWQLGTLVPRASLFPGLQEMLPFNSCPLWPQCKGSSQVGLKTSTAVSSAWASDAGKSPL